LSDFGFAKDGPSGYTSYIYIPTMLMGTTSMGTHGYAAPEYIAAGNLCSMICQPVIRHIGLLLF